jgi:hypothetical protein
MKKLRLSNTSNKEFLNMNNNKVGEKMLIIIYIISTIFGLILMKMGGKSLTFTLNNTSLNFSIEITSLLGLIFYLVSFLLWMIILSKSEIKLSVLFPVVTAVIQIIVIISGVLIFKEKINMFQIFGIILTITGIMLITYFKN